MNIDAKKINILEGSWVTKSYRKLIVPDLTKAGVPFFRQQILPITKIYDDEYWGELRSSHRIDLAIPDYRHWFFPDDVFEKYIERLASVRFPVLCIFEAPFGFEMPKIDIEAFAKKLFERSSKLAYAIKEKHPDTTLLSPSIYALKEHYRDQYLDFFIHSRHLFDGYAVNCCNDLSEHTLGEMSSFLDQVMSVSPKRLWITKWAVPCFDGKVINSQVMGPDGWAPYQSNMAGHRLQRSFSLIESIARIGSHWFYVGTGMDFYKPRRVPGPNEYWEGSATPVIPEEYSYRWQYRHFLGLLTSDGKVKEKLLKSFISLASNHNV